MEKFCSCGEIAPNKKSDLCLKCMEWKIRGKLDAYRKRALISEMQRKQRRK